MNIQLRYAIIPGNGNNPLAWYFPKVKLATIELSSIIILGQNSRRLIRRLEPRTHSTVNVSAIIPGTTG